MRVLVTGAGGFVGQHLIRMLLEDFDAEVAGGVFEGEPPGTGVLSSDELNRVTWLPLDVTSEDSVWRVVSDTRPERVYHLAGQSSVSGSFRDPIGTWEVNATGTFRLLEALREGGVTGSRALVVSSAEVYGRVPEDRQPITEGEALSPITPYGASKMAAEAAALQCAASKQVWVTIARSFNHAGPGQDSKFALPSMAAQLAEMHAGVREPLLQVGNLDPSRDFLDVRDVARAYVTMMERGESGRIYNVCSGEARPMTEIVKDLVRISGTGARIDVDPERFRPVEIPLLVGDPSRLTALGWTPEIPLERTLTDLLEAAGALADASPGAAP